MTSVDEGVTEEGSWERRSLTASACQGHVGHGSPALVGVQASHLWVHGQRRLPSTGKARLCPQLCTVWLLVTPHVVCAPQGTVSHRGAGAPGPGLQPPWATWLPVLHSVCPAHRGRRDGQRRNIQGGQGKRE